MTNNTELFLWHHSHSWQLLCRHGLTCFLCSNEFTRLCKAFKAGNLGVTAVEVWNDRNYVTTVVILSPLLGRQNFSPTQATLLHRHFIFRGQWENALPFSLLSCYFEHPNSIICFGSRFHHLQFCASNNIMYTRALNLAPNFLVIVYTASIVLPAILWNCSQNMHWYHDQSFRSIHTSARLLEIGFEVCSIFEKASNRAIRFHNNNHEPSFS